MENTDTELELTTHRRKAILEAILKRQDLGGKSEEYLLNCIENNWTPNSIDPITDLIMINLINSQTVEEFEEQMVYSTVMLTRAKDAIKNFNS